MDGSLVYTLTDDDREKLKSLCTRQDAAPETRYSVTKQIIYSLCLCTRKVRCPVHGCAVCPKGATDLIDHLNAVHIRHPVYKCGLCGKCYFSQRTGVRHWRDIHDTDREIYKSKGSRRPKSAQVDIPRVSPPPPPHIALPALPENPEKLSTTELDLFVALGLEASKETM